MGGNGIHDGRWQLGIEFFCRTYHAEWRSERVIIAIFELLRDDIDRDLVVLKRRDRGLSNGTSLGRGRR